MRLLHAVAFSKKLRWLAQTKVITSKTQPHAVNSRWKRVSQRSLRKRNCFFVQKKPQRIQFSISVKAKSMLLCKFFIFNILCFAFDGNTSEHSLLYKSKGKDHIPSTSQKAGLTWFYKKFLFMSTTAISKLFFQEVGSSVILPLTFIKEWCSLVIPICCAFN